MSVKLVVVMETPLRCYDVRYTARQNPILRITPIVIAPYGMGISVP
jgi:hypothetical protein